MKIVVTGGGTGGHIYPALEVARELIAAGDEVAYFGSFRGQEGLACERAGVAFTAFPSEPLYRFTSLRGLKGALNLARSMVLARKALMRHRPDAVFSTGGYSSAPVVGAAERLGIPFVIHEQNTVPGRTNRMLSRNAHAVATVFRTGAEHFPGARVVRTGMPIRPEFRRGQQGSLGFETRPSNLASVLVTGGSQGASALNEAALSTATRMTDGSLHWLHITGPKHYEGMLETLRKFGVGDGYELRAFLQAEEISSAMFACTLAVCRSGAGTLAELAALRKPSVLIPYTAAFGNHQYTNALEFVDMGAALMLEEKDLIPSALESRILAWLHDEPLQQHAARALAEWDVPDAVQRIVTLVREAAQK